MPQRTSRDDLNLDHLDPALAQRVRQTVACTDCDGLPKVDRAGQVIDKGGASVQVMHNGVLVEHGGYYGDWMAEIIRALRGHHEPQEELVFATMVDRIAGSVARDESAPVMVEFGAFWAYYSLWFCHDIATGRAHGLEPDPANLEVGRRNAALNGLDNRIDLRLGVVGERPGEMLEFTAETDGVQRPVRQYDLQSLMDERGLSHIDLLLIDIQGWERVLLERGRPFLREGRVRFVLVSTHHHQISGDPLTHQRVRDLILEVGGHIMAEHTVGESASGDGLIAASFDGRDADVTIDVSHMRARDSLFGELEYDLAAEQEAAVNAREQLAGSLAQLSKAQVELAESRKRVRRLRHRLRDLEAGEGAGKSSRVEASSIASRVRNALRLSHPET